MANISISAGLTLTATELSSSQILLNRLVPGLLNAVLTTYYFEAYRQVPNSVDVVPIPTPSGYAQIVYVKNVGTVGNIKVRLSPKSATTQVVVDLTPGSAMLMFEVDLTQGWSVVSLEASAGTIPVELLIGA